MKITSDFPSSSINERTLIFPGIDHTKVLKVHHPDQVIDTPHALSIMIVLELYVL